MNKTNIWKTIGLTGALVLETALQGCTSPSQLSQTRYDPSFDYSTKEMKVDSQLLKIEYEGNTLKLTSTDPDSFMNGREEIMYLNNGKLDSFRVKSNEKEYFTRTDTLMRSVIQPLVNRRLFQVRIRKSKK